MDLYWTGDASNQSLCVGAFGLRVGYMTRAKKHWEGWLEIPVTLSRKYASEADMRRLMVSAVTDWFQQAQTMRKGVSEDYV